VEAGITDDQVELNLNYTLNYGQFVLSSPTPTPSSGDVEMKIDEISPKQL
jgi:hypothetical protein